MKERERDESPKRENQPHQAQKGALLLLLLLLACFFIIIYSSSTNWVAYMEGNMGNWAFMGKISFGMERNRKRQTNQLFLLFLIQHITYSTYLCTRKEGMGGRRYFIIIIVTSSPSVFSFIAHGEGHGCTTGKLISHKGL
jgi:hypothetical protein